MSRTLAAVLFSFSLLIQSHAAFASGYYVLSKEDAKIHPIWHYTVVNGMASSALTTYEAGIGAMIAEITRVNARYGKVSCKANERIEYPAIVEKLAYPATDPFADPPDGVLYTHKDGHGTTVQSYATGTATDGTTGCYQAVGGHISASYYTPGPGCSVKDILPFGPPDPPDLDMTKISPALRAAANCLNRETGLSDGALFESGYRSLDYQKHFRDLWDKKIELEPNTDPLCAALKAKINTDFGKHGLGSSEQRPALSPSNCHTAGTCFDAKSDSPGSGTYTRIDLNSNTCNIYRPWPRLVPPGLRDDPGHTILQ